MLLSAIACLSIAIVLLPPVYLVVRAGFGDAWAILGRTQTLALIGRTLLLVVTVAAGAVVVGVPMAWLVTRTRLAGVRWWWAGCCLPLAIPSFVAALSLLGAFGPRGFLQQILEPFGVDRLPDIRGLPGATIALVMATFPYVFLLAVAALRNVDPSLEEAARGLGRRPVSVFMHVTLPHLRRAIAGGVLIAGLYVISDYGAVSLMRYDTITRAIFVRRETSFDLAPAAVLGVLLVGLTVLLLVLEHFARGTRQTHTLGSTSYRAVRPIELGRWAPVALVFASSVMAMFVVIPIAVLVYWVERAAASNRDVVIPWEAAFNTVLVSLLAAVLVTLAAIPVAVLARRYRRGWTLGLERAGFLSNAIPGVVIGLALVFFAVRYAPGIYQTLGLLLVGYMMRFFAQALVGFDTALAAVSPRLEEAARGLGRTPVQVLAQVTLPLMRPGLVAGATLVFLSTLKELPVTLILRPTGFDTLATEVWSKTGVGRYGEAAIPALMLLIVALPFVYLAAGVGARRIEEEPLPSVVGS